MFESATDPLLQAEAKAAQLRAADLRAATLPLGEAALDILFREARSHNGWSDIQVGDETLEDLYDLLRWGPTSMNCGPARFVFLRSREARERLAPALAASNQEKVRAAPVTVIIGYDLAFFHHLPELFPHRDNRALFTDNPEFTTATAFRNGTLQGAYLMLAARALGLDCGPMSGFDNKMVDRIFFGDTMVRSNFLCCLGYGNCDKLFQRLPRLPFTTACTLL